MTLPYVVGSATSKATAVAMADKVEGVRHKLHTFIGGMGEFGATMDEAFLSLGIKNGHPGSEHVVALGKALK